MSKIGAWLTLLLLVAAGGGQLAAQEDVDIAYDIFGRGDSVMVWIDLAPFVTPAQVQSIRDGLDLALEFHLYLNVPRRLWGARSVTKTQQALQIHFDPVTENFVLTSSITGWRTEHRFLSAPDLLKYLADSVETSLTAFDSLQTTPHYVLELKIIRSSLNGMALRSSSADSGGPSSPLEYLFRQFLSVTGFGRDEYSTKSRPFSRSEIVFEP